MYSVGYVIVVILIEYNYISNFILFYVILFDPFDEIDSSSKVDILIL